MESNARTTNNSMVKFYTDDVDVENIPPLAIEDKNKPRKASGACSVLNKSI